MVIGNKVYKSCPRCLSRNINAGRIDPVSLYRDVWCKECNFHWIETFDCSGNIYFEPEKEICAN